MQLIISDINVILKLSNYFFPRIKNSTFLPYFGIIDMIIYITSLITTFSVLVHYF